MIRLLHIAVITVLLGSAGYAYSTKYQSLYLGETLAKLKGKLQREREAVAVAKAEWALLTRPDRLQRMVDRHIDLRPMTIHQLARLSDLPARPSKSDEIARKLETLGAEPAVTGSLLKDKRPAAAAPKRDDIAAKLLSLGLAPAQPQKPKRPPEPRAALGTPNR